MDTNKTLFTDEDLNFIDRALKMRADGLAKMALDAKEPGATASMSRGSARHLQLRELVRSALSKTGADLIHEERARQTTTEGYSGQHDAHHSTGEIAWAAAHYAAPGPVVHEEDGSPVFPWEPEANKKDKHERIRQLVIAGALCAAEIDRLKSGLQMDAATKDKEKDMGKKRIIKSYEDADKFVEKLLTGKEEEFRLPVADARKLGGLLKELLADMRQMADER